MDDADILAEVMATLPRFSEVVSIGTQRQVQELANAGEVDLAVDMLLRGIWAGEGTDAHRRSLLIDLRRFAVWMQDVGLDISWYLTTTRLTIPPTWFAGDEPRTDDEAEFLARVRTPGWEWPTLGINHYDTTALARVVPFLIMVAIRPIPKGLNQLQVAFWPRDSNQPGWQAEWGDDHLLDNGGHPDEVDIGGPTLDPTTAGEQAAQWLRTQLQRTVTREDWSIRNGRVVASRWCLPDTGRMLASEGSWITRKRHPATQVTIVRPTST